ncbi:tumor necrosis factor receptor superfamily member 1B-like isoform X1 [Xyrichtys novacula]|uniref:Tumor necrosis factor receptor superfamily member 1B-like isoform X1 n=1 Tax=Xyrichtys novacula TaxID=13765 RepID=A0AAV1EP44_XYRNO|nr:tumor necrosis factor receptor superfamily member 1B-like isoform X1 [Xyrichtys novacula]
MKGLLALLVLLYVRIIEVCSQPYQPDSEGECRDRTLEYLVDDLNLCCKKCPPGHRLQQQCSEMNDTVCTPCSAGLYMEKHNYSPNCRTCSQCREIKGLRYARACSSTTMSKCECQPGMYCIIGFDNPYCQECKKYRICKAGFGVSVAGTADSNVRCVKCPDGTFSDTVSDKDPCRPHTDCHGKAVLRKGNATSDTVCESKPLPSSAGPETPTTEIHAEIFSTSAKTTLNTVAATSTFKAQGGLTNSTPHVTPSVPGAVFSNSTKSPPSSTVSDRELAAVIATVIGFILLFIAIMLVCLCRRVRKKDNAKFEPKIDANGNCEASNKQNNGGYLGETQMTSFTSTLPEQQYLLEKGETSSDQSQSSNTTDSLTRTEACSSEESIGPLQSMGSLHNPHSALSEPMPLLSNTESDITQTSVPTQVSSSQPTVTTSPQVNVNITFNIGNGSAGTPAVSPVDLMQADLKLPFGEEEESFSIPQQEDGKQSLMSAEETASYRA